MSSKLSISIIVMGVLILAMVACQSNNDVEPALQNPTQPSATYTLEPTLSSAPVSPARPPETIAIFDPKAGQPLSGGELQVNGYSEYFFESNLSLALCGAGGSGEPHTVCGTVDNVIAESYAMIQSPDIGQAGPFSGSLSYQIEQPVNATLVVYALSARDGSLLHASSVVVELNP
jgi:hypothetical protein